MMQRTILFIFLIGCLSATSCRRASPASFWRDYHTNVLLENKSDRGRHGGYSAMQWKSLDKHTFKKKEILAFAKKNGWQLTKVYKADSATVSTWKYRGKPVFPLSYHGFSPRNLNEPDYVQFKRYINGDVKVFAFKTGFISVEPETHDSTERTGFILLSDDGSQMAVYLLWGE